MTTVFREPRVTQRRARAPGQRPAVTRGRAQPRPFARGAPPACTTHGGVIGTDGYTAGAGAKDSGGMAADYELGGSGESPLTRLQ